MAVHKRKWLSVVLVGVLAIGLVSCKQVATPSVPNQESETQSEESAEQTGGVHAYSQAIGYLTTTAAPKAESEQEALVVQMQALKQEQASSKQIFELFNQNIEQLRPPYSDTFAAYAISAMQANSFSDTTQFDPYFTVAEGQIAYEDGLKTAGGSYLMLKRGRGEIKDNTLKSQLALAASQGYLLAMTEGYILPLVDFTEFAKYKAVYSHGFAALVDQFAYNSVQMLVNNGGVMTSLEDVAARMTVSEGPMADAKGTTYGKFLTLVYTENLRVLLTGAENTPVYAYETMKQTAEAKASLEAILAQKPSLTTGLVETFMETLGTSDGVYNDAVFSKIDALIEQVKTDYGVTEADITAYQHWLSGQSE